VIGFVPEGSVGLRKLRLARREGGALVYVGRGGNGVGPQDCVGGPAGSCAPCAIYGPLGEAAQEAGHDMG
jgi:hypothetical protein